MRLGTLGVRLQVKHLYLRYVYVAGTGVFCCTACFIIIKIQSTIDSIHTVSATFETNYE